MDELFRQQVVSALFPYSLWFKHSTCLYTSEPSRRVNSREAALERPRVARRTERNERCREIAKIDGGFLISPTVDPVVNVSEAAVMFARRFASTVSFVCAKNARRVTNCYKCRRTVYPEPIFRGKSFYSKLSSLPKTRESFQLDLFGNVDSTVHRSKHSRIITISTLIPRPANLTSHFSSSIS